MSFAKVITMVDLVAGTSAVYNWYNKRSRTLSWGTPINIGFNWVNSSDCWKNNYLCNMYDFINP